MSDRKSLDFLNSKFVFTSLDQARDLVSREDEYSKILSKFDLQAKVKKLGRVTQKEYLRNATKHLYGWHQYELDYISQLIQETETQVKKKKYRFDLPDEIFLIKSAMHEEGGANGFTRENYIVLNQSSLSQHLFEHELFHIISRFNQKKMEHAYGVLGFSKCNEVPIPSPYVDWKITNPDAPFNNHFIKVKHNNDEVEVLMYLYSKSEYSGGSFFSYLNKGLLVLEDENGAKKASIKNNHLNILAYEEVDGLMAQIGRNTGYNIHQEELTADHFSMSLNDVKDLPDQHLVDGLDAVLKS